MNDMFHTSFLKILTGSWEIPHIPRRRHRNCPPSTFRFSFSSFSSPPKFLLGAKEYHTLSYGPVLGPPFHLSIFPSLPLRRLSLPLAAPTCPFSYIPSLICFSFAFFSVVISPSVSTFCCFFVLLFVCQFAFPFGAAADSR